MDESKDDSLTMILALAVIIGAPLMASYPNMPLYKLPQDNGEACLDGTPPAYWFLNASSSASSTKYYINFEVSVRAVFYAPLRGLPARLVDSLPSPVYMKLQRLHTFPTSTVDL